MTTEALRVIPGKAEGVWIVHSSELADVNPWMLQGGVMVWCYLGDYWRCELCQRKASANPCVHIKAVQEWLKEKGEKL